MLLTLLIYLQLKVRISQVTIECLEKMELNPDYALSVITKEESEKEESEKISETNEEEADEDQNSDEKMVKKRHKS